MKIKALRDINIDGVIIKKGKEVDVDISSDRIDKAVENKLLIVIKEKKKAPKKKTKKVD
jgi:hypothetical protein